MFTRVDCGYGGGNNNKRLTKSMILSSAQPFVLYKYRIKFYGTVIVNKNCQYNFVILPSKAKHKKLAHIKRDGGREGGIIHADDDDDNNDTETFKAKNCC